MPVSSIQTRFALKCIKVQNTRVSFVMQKKKINLVITVKYKKMADVKECCYAAVLFLTCIQTDDNGQSF